MTQSCRGRRLCPGAVALPNAALPPRGRAAAGEAVCWAGVVILQAWLADALAAWRGRAGCLARGRVGRPLSRGGPFANFSPNPALQATGRIKPRPSPELSRWALEDGALRGLSACASILAYGAGARQRALSLYCPESRRRLCRGSDEEHVA